MQNLRMATLAAASLACVSFVSFGGTLAEDFSNPPQKAGVHAWWHWVGYNVSKAGITRDLEAMKSAGLGGATIFTIASHSGRWNGEAVKIHLDNVLKPLVEHLGPLVGKSFKHILMDSYEAGDCNWTQTFREDFIASRGYDPLPYLPVMAGAAMPDADRFKEDMKIVVGELFTKNHYRQFHDRLAELGLDFQMEPYGGPFDGWEAACFTDVPMVEFWFSAPWYKPGQLGGYPIHVGAVGRAFGRNIVASEAFTGGSATSGWSRSPRATSRTAAT